MGYTIRSRKTKQFVTMSTTCWRKTLELAELHGWEPGQTQLSFKKGFQSLVAPPPFGLLGYLRAGVIITAEDSLRLGVALSQAYPYVQIPQSDQLFVTMTADQVEPILQDQLMKAYAINKEALKDMEVQVPNASLHPYEYFGGKDRPMIFYFSDLCKSGSLLIDDRSNQEIRMSAEKFFNNSGKSVDMEKLSISRMQLP